MKFISVRMITADINDVVGFYEKVLDRKANWATSEFAEIESSKATLAIGSIKTLAFFGENIASPKSNNSIILEFQVADVDESYERVKELAEIVQKPTTMPWGNRSLLFRDPDQNLVNFFTPVSDEAIKKFSDDLRNE